MNEQIYKAAVQLMAACIEAGHVQPFADVTKTAFNKYCVEKAIQLQKDVEAYGKR